MNTGTVLETKRLILKPATNEDNAVFLEIIRGDGDFALFCGMEFSETRLLEFQGYFARKDTCFYSMFCKKDSDNAFIGYVGINFDSQTQRYEAEFYLGRRYRGQGYATEALQKVVDAFFSEKLCMDGKCITEEKLFATTLEKNEPSVRLLERVGFGWDQDMPVLMWKLYEDPEDGSVSDSGPIVERVLEKGVYLNRKVAEEVMKEDKKMYELEERLQTDEAFRERFAGELTELKKVLIIEVNNQNKRIWKTEEVQMAITFREIRKYISRVVRLSICFEDGSYDNYHLISDIPEDKYGDMYVYGIGMVDVEFPKDVYSEAKKGSQDIKVKEMFFGHALEIVLYEKDRGIERKDCQVLRFGDVRNFLQIGRNFSVMIKGEWEAKCYEYRREIPTDYDDMLLYGIGIEDNLSEYEKMKKFDYLDTYCLKRMVLVLERKEDEE